MRRFEEGPPAATGMPHQGPPHLPPAGAGPEEPSVGTDTTNNFLARLPPQFTADEEELAGAVVAFLRAWYKSHGEGSHPNLVHVGADPRIRDLKAAALPREVALKTWLKHRLVREVHVKGQSVALASLDSH